MKKLSILLVVTLLGTGCATLSSTQGHINEAKAVLHTLGPQVGQYSVKKHKCPPAENQAKADEWAQQLQTKQSVHWSYYVIPGQTAGSCFIGANYKYNAEKGKQIFPHLALQVENGTPSSVIVLNKQEFSNSNYKGKIIPIVKTHETDAKTCRKWGGQMNEELGCVVY